MDTTTELTSKPSICPLDCPDTCSLSVKTDGIEVLEVRGSRSNPYTAGVICEKVAKYYPEFVHGARRLKQPLRRTGPRGSGQFEVIGWDQALDITFEGISKAVDRHGPQSVLPFNYAGPHGQLAVGSMDLRFFHRLGASQLDRGPLCGGVRGLAYSSLFGTGPGMPPEQAADADVVAVWGNNVTVSNLHFARVLQAARKRGAKLVVVDPKRIRIAEQADLFVQIAPGTDAVLALAMAAELERRGAFNHEFIERWVHGFGEYMAEARKYSLDDAARICRVPSATIDALLTIYANAQRLSLSVGNGIERGHSGGSGLRAIMSLNALLGQLGRPGAGVFAKPGLAYPATPAKLHARHFLPEGTRTINIVDVGKFVAEDAVEPPIRALFIYNHNPVATHPDQVRMRQALSREDVFVAGSDVVMTDSMAYCDVVFPAASHFEFDDIYGAYGHSYLQRAEPVIPTVGESVPNTELFRRLAARFGFDEPEFKASDRQLMDDAYDPDDPRLGGWRPSELPLDTALLMRTTEGETVRLCGSVAPGTATGKVELFSQDLEDQYGYGVPRYEPVPGLEPVEGLLNLISPSSNKRTNATFGGDPASAHMEILEIHPDDAATRSIEEGQRVRIWNTMGEVILRAKLSDAMQPGVVYSPKGTWLDTSETGMTVNGLLNADRRTDILRGACYNDTFVDLAPADN